MCRKTLKIWHKIGSEKVHSDNQSNIDFVQSILMILLARSCVCKSMHLKPHNRRYKKQLLYGIAPVNVCFRVNEVVLNNISKFGYFLMKPNNKLSISCNVMEKVNRLMLFYSSPNSTVYFSSAKRYISLCISYADWCRNNSFLPRPERCTIWWDTFQIGAYVSLAVLSVHKKRSLATTVKHEVSEM